MQLKYKLLPGGKAPYKKNKSDIGWDVFAYSMRINGEEIQPGVYRNLTYIEYNLGICIQPVQELVRFGSYLGGAFDPPPSEIRRYYTYLAPRSSVSDRWLTLANGMGTLDAGWVEPVLARFRYNYQPSDVVFLTETGREFGIKINTEKIYQIGERCAQLNVTLQPDVEPIMVDMFEETDRKGGLGSTGQT